jgi:hypothetical protein
VPTCEELKNGSFDTVHCLDYIRNSLREAKIFSYHVTVEELEERMKATGRKGIRYKQLLYDSRKRMGY